MKIKKITILALSVIIVLPLLACKDKKTTNTPSATKEVKNLLNQTNTEWVKIDKIKTSSYVSKPKEDNNGSFIKIEEDGDAQLYEIKLYTSAISKDQIPQKIYIWTDVLPLTKEKHKLKCFVLDQREEKTGKLKKYAYISGKIVTSNQGNIIIFTKINNKISAIEYYNTNNPQIETNKKLLKKVFAE